MKRLVALWLCLLPQAHAAPFLMLASTSDPQVFPVLQQFFRHGDYLSARISAEVPRLGELIGRERQFVLPASLNALSKHLGCGAGTPGIVVYDIEHWDDTPAAEQQQPAKSIAEGASRVHANRCQQYAVAPDGQFMGLKEGACSYGFDAGIYRTVDWSQVDLLSIQAQRILSDTCAQQLTVDDYAGFVTRVRDYVKGKNPSIVVVTQFSFRHTPPEKMVDAMRKLAQVVDGFYFAYPSHQKNPCHYCSAENVAAAVSARPSGLRE